MKRYRYTTTTSLMSLFFIGISFFCSCSDEEAVDAGGKTVTAPSLSIQAGVESILTRGTDDPAQDSRNQNGSWMINLTLFLFASDAGDGDTPLLTKTISVDGANQQNQANELQLSGKELSQANIGVGSHVAIYAIANHIPANADNLTKKQMLSLTGTLPNYTKSQSRYVPMTGKIINYEIKSEANQNIPLTMQRAVIKVNLTITDAEFDQTKYDNLQYSWEITSVKLYNDYASTYLWNEGIPATPGYRNENSGIGTTTIASPSTGSHIAGTFYLNCNEASANHTPTDPIKIKVSGSRTNENGVIIPFEYTVDLKKADGTFLFERNTNIVATLMLAGSAELKIETLPWTAEVTTDIPATKPLNLQPKANCYIMKPNSEIVIPVSQVADAHVFDNSIAAISADEALTAELIWTDVKGATSGKGVADDASVASIEMLGSGPNALLRVTSGTQAGNSLVAVKDTNGSTKWSWQIWVTDYDPEITNYVHNGNTIMDRNLGAMTNQPISDGSNSNGVIGTFYQWGRPTPLQTESMTTAKKTTTIYDANGKETNVVYYKPESMPTIGLLIQQSHCFCDTPYSEYRELWGNETNRAKTPLDPCPAGWRVAFMADMPHEGTNDIAGIHRSYGFFPKTSKYDSANGLSSNREVAYWTANVVTTIKFYSWGYYAGYNNLDSRTGLPVRCVKEK